MRHEEGSGKEMVVDSIVHRYGREIGFKTATSGQIAEGDERARAAQQRGNTVTHKPLSTLIRVRGQSYLECYALSMHENDAYSVFLKSLQEDTENVKNGILDVANLEKKELIPPSDTLVQSWMYHMRDGDEDETAANNPEITALPGRQNKWSTIDTYLKSVSSTLKEFGQKTFVHSTTISDLFNTWKEEDATSRAKSFELEELLPKLYFSLFDHNYSLPYKKKVALWS
jgi:hypothetical protein